MKKTTILLFVVLLILGFAACKGKENAEESPDVSVSPTTEPSATTSPSESPGTTPVFTDSPEPTETPVEEGFNVPEEGARPWAVSIDNQGDIPFPQGGLEDAQIVYELRILTPHSRRSSSGIICSMINPLNGICLKKCFFSS